MRDILITAIVFFSLFFILKKPYIGVLMWSWIGYMNPHRLGWGFAYNLPFAAIIGVVTLISIPFSKEPKRIPINSLTITWLILIVWFTITSIFSDFPELAWQQWEKVIKIQLMILITLLLINNRERLQSLIWVIVLSIGFYGIKGGIFTIITGGNYMVWGPPGSFIEGNNELAFALTTILPLMWYLRTSTENKWVKWFLLISMLLTTFSILASYSRGAFLALIAIGFFLVLKSNKKAIILLIIIVLIPLALALMPGKWTDRIDTIGEYQSDGSAMGRIYVWKLATIIAQDNPIFGGGFQVFSTRTYHHRYGFEITGDFDTYIATDAHSIYFLILGEHGYIGLIIFLFLLFFAFKTGKWIIKNTKDNSDLFWARDMAAMIQVALVGYMVAGAFVGQPYFDLYYHLIAILAILRFIIENYNRQPN